MKSILMAIVMLAAAATAGAKDYPATPCDQLAANPEDEDVIAPPVPRTRVDLPQAIAACEAEVALHPDNARARYQLSRVLAYAGQSERGTAEMKRAADEGYRQAQFVYGLLIDRHRPDAPANPCLVEDYWLRSARAGRQAARVSYVRHVLNGKFDACRIQAAPAELKGFLDAAFPDTTDYFDRLLLKDLTAQLDARMGERSTPPPYSKASIKRPKDAIVTDCDRLASHPEDPDIVTTGVSGSKVDVPKAIAVCTTAVEREPGNARLRYQLARVLAYNGDSKRATEEMKRAADDGHRQAQFVYGLFVDRKRPDAPNDICVAEDYWLKAARAGRQAARVIYVQRLFQGRFDACSVQAAPTELGELLELAATEARDFYERLLVDELRDRHAERILK
jgi:Flp pilus assembly protein TadD